MKRILVIDDDPVESFITEQILRHVGFEYQLHKAIHGQDGVRALGEICQQTESCPDIILLDLYMPIMDGFTFLEKFPTHNLPGKEKTRLIVLTISHDRAGAERAMSLGAHGVLNKPLQLEQLQEIIGKD